MMTPPVKDRDHERVREALSLYKTRDLDGLFDLAVIGIDAADDAQSWRFLAIALEGMALARTAQCDAWLSQRLGFDVSTYGSPDLALWGFRVAWERSGKTDEVSRRQMDQLRATLGYHREDWCWNCHEYLSDAPLDNAERCRRYPSDCLLCRSCGAHRCQAPYRRAD